MPQPLAQSDTSLVHKAPTSTFLASNAILWTGMMVNNGLTYVTQVLVVRLLGQQEFGVFASLISLLYLLLLPAAGLQTVVARKVAELQAAPSPQTVDSHVRLWIKLAFIVGTAMALLVIAVSPWLASFLHLDSAWVIVLMAPAGLVGTLLPAARGFLQGSEKFPFLSANLGLEGLCRLLFTLGLAYLAASAAAAAIGYGLASLGPLLVLLPMLRRMRGDAAATESLDAMTWVIIISSTVLIVLPNLDVLFARHFLSATDAGSYAGAVILGRVIIFAASTVPMVMIPLVIRRVEARAPALRLFVWSFGLTLLIAGAVLLLPVMWPSEVISLLYGPQFSISVSLLITYGVSMVLYSLVNLCASLLFAFSYRRVAWVMVAAVFLETALVLIFHARPIDIAADMLVAQACTLAWLLFEIVRNNRDLLFGRRAEASAVGA